jgi:hypothetical protein
VVTVARARRSVPLTGLALCAALAGAVVAYVDSRPGYDAAGLTVFSLVGLSAVVAFVGRRRPWLWALLIGLPTPLVEVASSGDPSPIAALAFAGLGAALGWGLRALVAGVPDASRE